MKTRILTASFLLLFTANTFAQTTNAQGQPELSSQTEREGLITAKRVIIGTALTLAATIAGYYYFLRPEMRMLAPKNTRNALEEQPLRLFHNFPPQDFAKNPTPVVAIPVILPVIQKESRAQAQQNLLDNEAELQLAIQNSLKDQEPLKPVNELDHDAEIREATELSLAIANSFEDQAQQPIAEKIDTTPTHEASSTQPAIVEEKKKKARPCGYLLTNNLCVFTKIDDPNFQYTVNSAITINGQPYQPVNSHTDLTNLNSNHAFVDPDEIIVINSETALMLDVIYQEMLFLYREQYPNGSTQEQFFAFLIGFIRSHVFDASRPGSKSDAVNELIKEISTDENIFKIKTTNPNRVIPVINFAQHLKARVGVCRHYSLVLVHLAQRFIKEQDSCLTSGSAHISAARAAEEAHVWGVYIDATGHAGLHVDALWDLNLNLDEQKPLDSSLLESLLTADRTQFLEDSLDLSQNNQLQNSEPQWGTQGGIYSFSVSDEEEVKEDAQTPEWMSGSIDLGDANRL